MKTQKIIFLSALIVMFCSTAHATSSVDEIRSMPMDGLVQVENLAGSITITVWDRAEVGIVGELGSSVEELEIIESSSGIQISVENSSNRRNVSETHLRLQVPVTASVEAEGVSADVTVNGLEGVSLIMTSVSGDVTAKAQVDRLEAESVSGDVTFRGHTTRAAVETVSGEIDLQGLEGEVRVSTVSGDLDMVGERIDRGRFETVSGDLEVSLDVLDGGRLNAESLSGDVRLMLSAGQQADFDAQTYSGKIRSDFGSVKNKSHGAGSSLSHREGSNGTTISVESFSGDIRISGG
jgi:DUF4097 and DUF4098 domain-containing protein YvlB